MTKHNHLALGTGQNEWYTPAKHIELARKVLGGIDLDPASNAKAQETVRAKAFFTADDDGLTKEWNGRIWLNPPYSRGLISRFVDKLIEERLAGRVTAAIMLTNRSTDTAWFHRAAKIVSAICFTRGRIRFVNPEGKLASPTQGQIFFYFGDDVPLFKSVFNEIGKCMSIVRGK